MSISDIFVILIIAVFTLTGIYHGFIRAAARAVASLVSTVISMLTYPLAASLVRQTDIYPQLKEGIILNLGLRDAAMEATKQGQGMLIDSLPVQPVFKEKLMVNNNSVIYDLLGVDNIVDYVGGFLANIVINVVVSILVYLISYAVINFIFTAFKLLRKAPVVRTAERVGGGMAGFFAAVLVIWVCFAVLDMFVGQPFFEAAYEDIQQSAIAIGFYNTDIIRTILLERMF